MVYGLVGRDRVSHVLLGVAAWLLCKTSASQKKRCGFRKQLSQLTWNLEDHFPLKRDTLSGSMLIGGRVLPVFLDLILSKTALFFFRR